MKRRIAKWTWNRGSVNFILDHHGRIMCHADFLTHKLLSGRIYVMGVRCTRITLYLLFVRFISMAAALIKPQSSTWKRRSLAANTMRKWNWNAKNNKRTKKRRNLFVHIKRLTTIARDRPQKQQPKHLWRQRLNHYFPHTHLSPLAIFRGEFRIVLRVPASHTSQVSIQHKTSAQITPLLTYGFTFTSFFVCTQTASTCD